VGSRYFILQQARYLRGVKINKTALLLISEWSHVGMAGCLLLPEESLPYSSWMGTAKASRPLLAALNTIISSYL